MAVRTDEIRNRVMAELDNHSYYVRKDIDAINEGSNLVEYPEDSRVAQHVIEEMGIDDDNYEEIIEVYGIVAEVFEEVMKEIEELNEEEDEEE